MDELEKYIISIYNGPMKKSNKPELLYQYTDITALQGIVENNVLWATHCRYLNDKRELDYGLRIAVKYANREKNKTKDQNVKQLLEEISGIYEFAKRNKELPFHSLDVFTASLSAQCDLLSQWRGYGKKYKSVCIGMDVDELMAGADSCNWFVFLRKVIYDSKKQVGIMKNYMDKVCDIVKNNPLDFSNPNYMKTFRHKVDLGLIIFALCFKEKCWEEEDEWRLMAVHHSTKNGNPKEICFKENDYGLVPYIKIPVSNNNSVFDTIKKVILPKSEMFIRAKKSLDMFFSQRKKNHSVKIEKSKISIVY